MELILTLAMKFWMWSVLIVLIIIGFAINLFDRKRAKAQTTGTKKAPSGASFIVC